MTGRGEEAMVPSPLSSSSLLHPPSPVEETAKEEQGDCMEKWFLETKGKHSSSGAWRHIMARSGVWITLEVDKWEMMRVSMSLGWVGWVAGRAHGICAIHPLLSCSRKVRNGNCEGGCKGKLIPKKSSLSGWRGVPSYKRARVHNNFKSEDLLLKWKVYFILYTIC